MLCPGAALGSGVPCHAPIFRAQPLGQAHPACTPWQQHEAVAVFEHRAQLYPGQAGKADLAEMLGDALRRSWPRKRKPC